MPVPTLNYLILEEKDAFHVQLNSTHRNVEVFLTSNLVNFIHVKPRQKEFEVI